VRFRHEDNVSESVKVRDARVAMVKDDEEKLLGVSWCWQLSEVQVGEEY
jgi:hypothetical protein